MKALIRFTIIVMLIVWALFSFTTKRITAQPAPDDRTAAEFNYLGQMAWSADGQVLAVPAQAGVWLFTVTNGTINKNSTPRYIPLAGEKVMALAFSPDGDTLAIGENNRLSVWALSPTTAILLHDLQVVEDIEAVGGFGVRALTFSPDGSQLAAGIERLGSGGGVLLWDTADYTPIPFDSPYIVPFSLAYSPDGRRLAIGYGEYLGSVLVLVNLANPEDVLRIVPYNRNGEFPLGVDSIVFNADGTEVFIAGNDVSNRGRGQIYSTVTGDLIARYQITSLDGNILFESYIAAAAPDMTTAAISGSGGTIVLTDVRAGRNVHRLADHDGGIFALRFSPDGTTLAVMTSRNQLYLWRVADGSLQAQFSSEDFSQVRMITPINPAELDLVIGGRATITTTGGDRLRMRSNPGTSFELIARIDSGAIVEILDGPVKADGFTWWQIRVPGADNLTGWVVESVDGLRTLTPLP